MPEMPVPGKGHCHAPFIGGCNHVRIFYGTARLNGCRGSRFRSRDQSIREREESVTANNRSFERQLGFTRFPNRDPARIHPAHLSRPDADRAIRARINNRIRFYMFHHPPAKLHRLQLRFRRLPFGDDF